jgi:DNA-directed RNA polymerase subunit K/omega
VGGQGAPPNIPDGSDDDVVARQLREAAEKETDPELKEKLWEEYRKYKAGTR